MYHYGYLCPSDSSLRLDLINLIKGDQEKSQSEKEKIVSKSKNTPWINKKLKGQVRITIVGGRIVYEREH
mgnify:CR=1 FL=1